MSKDLARPIATGSALVAAATLAASLFLLWHTFDPSYETSFASAGRGPVFFPRILLVIIVLLSAAVMAQSLLRGQLAEDGSTPFEWRQALSVALAAAVTGLYLYLIYVVGYLLASIAFSFVLPLVFGYRRWIAIAVFAAVYATVTWYVFEVIFHIVLPKSSWFIYF